MPTGGSAIRLLAPHLNRAYHHRLRGGNILPRPYRSARSSSRCCCFPPCLHSRPSSRAIEPNYNEHWRCVVESNAISPWLWCFQNHICLITVPSCLSSTRLNISPSSEGRDRMPRGYSGLGTPDSSFNLGADLRTASITKHKTCLANKIAVVQSQF